MAVVTDRSQGGSSLANGTIELMQNRKFNRDDEKGIGYDFLNEHIDNNNQLEGVKVKATYLVKLTLVKKGTMPTPE